MRNKKQFEGVVLQMLYIVGLMILTSCFIYSNSLIQLNEKVFADVENNQTSNPQNEKVTFDKIGEIENLLETIKRKITEVKGAKDEKEKLKQLTNDLDKLKSNLSDLKIQLKPLRDNSLQELQEELNKSNRLMESIFKNQESSRTNESIYLVVLVLFNAVCFFILYKKMTYENRFCSNPNDLLSFLEKKGNYFKELLLRNNETLAKIIGQQIETKVLASQDQLKHKQTLPKQLVQVVMQKPQRVSDWRQQHSHQLEEMSFDPLGKTFNNQANGHFYLWGEGDSTCEEYYIVPSLDRLATRSEFNQIYENVFECETPQSGNILILEPAKVDKNKMLTQKGKIIIE